MSRRNSFRFVPTFIHEHIKYNLSYQAEIKETIKQLRSSTRTLCRLSGKSNSTVIPKLRHLATAKHPSISSVEEKIQELKAVLFDRLRTGVEEERARQNQITTTLNKEQRTNQEVAVLKEELRVAQELRNDEISKKDEVIKQLKDQLREIKTHAEESTKRMESRSKQKEDLEVTQFQSREIRLEMDIKEAQKKLDDTQTSNREEEVAMRKKKAKIENEVEAWISKYDQEMDEKQNEIDELMAIYNEEHANLEELMRKYDSLSKNWQSILDERARQEEIVRQKKLEEQRKIALATKLQAMWRGYSVRKEIKKKKKADKKGGKKK